MNHLSKRNSFFDDFFTKDLLDLSRSRFGESSFSMPSVNVREDDKCFEIQVAAPGMKKEEFNISLERNVLTISSEKKYENEEVEEKYTRREFNYSSFSRSFTLPEQTEHDAISAVYEDGILKVSVPKKEANTQVTKTIEVK